MKPVTWSARVRVDRKSVDETLYESGESLCKVVSTFIAPGQIKIGVAWWEFLCKFVSTFIAPSQTRMRISRQEFVWELSLLFMLLVKRRMRICMRVVSTFILPGQIKTRVEKNLRVNESLQYETSQNSIHLLPSKIKPVQSWWQCNTRVDKSWRLKWKMSYGYR